MLEYGVGVRENPQLAAEYYAKDCNLAGASCDKATYTPPPPPDPAYDWTKLEGKCEAEVLIDIPGGTFRMGAAQKDGGGVEVQVSAFRLHRGEVTMCQFLLCVKAGKCIRPQAAKMWPGKQANLPITGVNQDQARLFCEWRSGRLPSEAEWEYAARGSDGRAQPWGDLPLSCKLADYGGETCQDGPALAGAHPDGKSPFGVLDLVGNVAEWTGDWYRRLPDAGTKLVDPKGPESGQSVVVRGASWRGSAEMATALYRGRWSPRNAGSDVGFRCAFDAKKK
jgi:formylglycine-generating enzyme required for sulfatase activity